MDDLLKNMEKFSNLDFSSSPQQNRAKAEKKWEEYLKRSKLWKIRVGYDLLHSKAYQELKYGPGIKTLNWFYEKVWYRKLKNKRGHERYQIVNGGEMSFTYKEAQLRGLTKNQFSRALKDLFRFGFIDLKKHGSGLHGDCSIYVLSERWRDFGTYNFTNQEFPKVVPYGYRGKKMQHLKINVGQR